MKTKNNVKSPTFLLALLMLGFLYSCGPSAVDIAQQQRTRDDSVKHAVERKYTVNEELGKLQVQMGKEEQQLKNLKASLEAETDRMAKIKEWQLGRSTDDREKQIKEQSLTIQNIQDGIAAISKRMDDNKQQYKSLQTELARY